MTQAVVGNGSRAGLALLLGALGGVWPVFLEAQERRDGPLGARGGDRDGRAAASEARSGGDPSGSSSSGSSRGSSPGSSGSLREQARIQALDRSVQAQLAPRLSGIQHDIRQGRIEQAARDARGALAVAEDTAGRSSQAVGDALEVLIEARSAQGAAPGRESRRMLERLVEIRNPDGPGRRERPSRAGEGLVVARPPKRDPVAPPTTKAAPPPTDSASDDRRKERLPHAYQRWGRLPGVTPDSCELILGSDVESTLLCMDALIYEAVGRGNMVVAESFLRQAAQYRKGLRFEDELAHAENLFVLGDIERRLMDYREASAFLEEALALRQRRLGGGTLVANTLHELANVHFMAGRYAEARPLYERALGIWESNGRKSRRAVITALDNLGQLLMTTGDYTGARRLLERALAVAESEVGRNHPLVANCLTSYGTLLHWTGDFAGARQRNQRALAILEKRLGPEDPALAGPLGNLANLSIHAGDYTLARVQLERTLSILQKAVTENNPALVPPLLSLANLNRLTSQGDPAALLERALRIQESVLGPSHPVVASLLTDLAKAKQLDLFLSQDALALASRALSIRRRVFGEEHPLYGESLANVGDQWLARGQPRMARPLYEEAAEVMEKALGAEHPALAYVLLRLTLVRFDAGDRRAALETALRTERISAAHLAWTLGGLPEGEALRYATTRISALDLALSLLFDGSEETARAAVWDSVIRSRAAVLDEMAGRKRGVGTGLQAVAASLELTQATRHLAQLVVRATSEDDGFDQYQRLIAAARDRRDTAERTLAAIVAPRRRSGASRGVGLAETLAALPPRSALVAFTRYRHYSRASEDSIPAASDLKITPSYAAFVWSEAAPFPLLVPIGSAQAIDALVDGWRREGARPLLDGDSGDASERTYRAAAINLRRRVWDPIEPQVRSAERVFLVPDGSLNLLSWAALPVAETGYLVDAGPTIHYLSAERDLIGFTIPRPSGRGMLALGEPAFDEGRFFSAWNAARGGTKMKADTRRAEVAALRGGSPDCSGAGTFRFDPLPASGREAASVADLWDRRPVEAGAAALRLIANEASEAAFKRMASGRRVLHLATHGFFLDSRCAAPSIPGHRGVGGLVGADLPETQAPDAPLRLAGLALAGANQRRWAGPKEEDGILTAEEIATLDLSGVEWAVLSACNTGVGTVRAGEGVLGLRRAFEVAGAGTLIMSLWPVDDEAAGLWMRGLYRARLEHGLATDEAVRSASREVLNERRRRGLDTHPHSWAAFVAAGNWR